MKTFSRIILFLIFCVLLSSFALADEERDTSVLKYKHVELDSKKLGEKRDLQIYLPSGYEDSKDSYPVLVLLDADYETMTNLKVSTAGIMADEGQSPEMIVIAIEVINSRRDYFAPQTMEELNGTSAVEKFRDFILEEVLPYAEKNYRTQPLKILSGDSNAGMFTLFTFLTKPESFNAFIAASPMLGWNIDIFNKLADKFIAEQKDVKSCVYANFGVDDYARATDHAPAFFAKFDSSENMTFRRRLDKLELTGHVPYTTLYEGLRFYFEGYYYSSSNFPNVTLQDIQKHYAELSERLGFTFAVPYNVLEDYGFVLRRNDKPAESLEVFEALVNRFSHEVRPYLGKALALRDMGKFDEALKAIDAAPVTEDYKAFVERYRTAIQRAKEEANK